MASTKPGMVSDVKTSPAQQVKAMRAPSPAMHPFWKIAHVIGSLQLAISAGFVFTIAMIIGTCLESWYSDKIAQELIYYTWWFTCLLALLACCIFFAAVKKWPWKKHQTGFLITHVGLLTMLAGGVLNTFLGVDASMRLVDSQVASQAKGVAQKSRNITMNNQLMVTLDRQRPDSDGKMQWQTRSVEIKPGPLPWGSDLGKSIPVPGMIRILSMMANPFSRAISYQPYDDVRLDVIAHLPHCRVEPLEEAPTKAFGFPAVKLEINTRETMRIKPAWTVLTLERERRLFPYLSTTFRAGILVELLGTCHPSLIDEFIKPPAEKDLGKLGQLVFSLKGEKHRINVAEQLGKTVPLAATGWKVKVESYSAIPDSKDSSDSPEFPSVLCDVISPEGKVTKYKVVGRVIASPGPLNHLGDQETELDESLPAVWYHAPDIRYGYDGKDKNKLHIRNMLQFAQTFDGKLYYRSHSEQNGKLQLEDAGEAPAFGVERKIWEQRAGNFIIEEHIPHARFGSQRVVPVTKRPGLLDEEHPPAVLARVTLTKKDSQGNTQAFSKERWVPMFTLNPIPFAVTGMLDGKPVNEAFGVQFGNKQAQLDFAIELTRAESQLDPGTTRAATYTSFVKLYDEKRDIYGENHVITMNEPLDYLGYKVYQSRFENFGIDEETGKPLAGSVFTVGRDPGLWLKYLGTGMIGIGIATMYYMRAYFFKPKRRPGVT